MATQKKFDIENLTLPIMGLFILIGFNIFLFSGDVGLTGWQALKLQGGAFWVIGVLCILLAIYLGWRLYLGNKNEKWAPGVKWAVFGIILLLLVGPFGRGCTDKTNAGYTAPGHQVVAP